jgi:hypothetical protein
MDAATITAETLVDRGAQLLRIKRAPLLLSAPYFSWVPFPCTTGTLSSVRETRLAGSRRTRSDYG